MNKNSETALVIDIGSNSIKSLLARRAPDGQLQTLAVHLIDARISAGISQKTPLLADTAQAAALDAIRELLRQAAAFNPTITRLVATSAVRDAANRDDFIRLVREKTGHTLRILTGDEEAAYIGQGAATDPALRDLQTFNIFDLGGGSLEILHYENKQLRLEKSLPLGCVRLTEQFIKDTSQPIPPETQNQIAARVQNLLGETGGTLSALRAATGNIFCGGSMSTARALLAHPTPLDKSPPIVTRDQIARLIEKLAPLTLAQRKQIPAMPPARADVFPAALITMRALADLAGISQFHHTHHNLRHGLADSLLT